MNIEVVPQVEGLFKGSMGFMGFGFEGSALILRKPMALVHSMHNHMGSAQCSK